MRPIFDSFKAPLETPFVDERKRGFFSDPWNWFFRKLQERMYPLGEELNQVLVNNLNQRTFATSDVNTSTDTITESNHNLQTGMRVRFTTTGTLPTGLFAGFDYYAIRTGASTFKVATSEGRAERGDNVTLSTQGTGTHTVDPRPSIDGMKFSARGVTCAFVEYICQRITSSAELTEGGLLMFTYNPTSENWTKTVIIEENPDDAGLTIGISADGQAYYQTSNVSGTPSISSLFYRNRTLSGKNINYSDVNRR